MIVISAHFFSPRVSFSILHIKERAVKGAITNLIQPPARIPIRHHLNRRVHARRQVRARGYAHVAHAEAVGSALAEGGAQDNVVG